MSGWSAALGSAFGSRGYRPLTIAGTANSVNPLTVVSFRYHVEADASRAKFGYNSASTLPAPSSNVSRGSSSTTIITTRFGLAISAPDSPRG